LSSRHRRFSQQFCKRTRLQAGREGEGHVDALAAPHPDAAQQPELLAPEGLPRSACGFFGSWRDPHGAWCARRRPSAVPRCSGRRAASRSWTATRSRSLRRHSPFQRSTAPRLRQLSRSVTCPPPSRPCGDGSPSPWSSDSLHVRAAIEPAPNIILFYDIVRLDPLLSDRTAPLPREPSGCGWRRAGSRGCSVCTEMPILRGIGSSVCPAPFDGIITGGEISVAGSVDKLALLREVRRPQGGAAGAV